MFRLLNTATWGIQGNVSTLLGKPGGNFVALALFNKTFTGEIFANDE